MLRVQTIVLCQFEESKLNVSVDRGSCSKRALFLAKENAIKLRRIALKTDMIPGHVGLDSIDYNQWIRIGLELRIKFKLNSSNFTQQFLGLFIENCLNFGIEQT